MANKFGVRKSGPSLKRLLVFYAVVMLFPLSCTRVNTYPLSEEVRTPQSYAAMLVDYQTRSQNSLAHLGVIRPWGDLARVYPPADAALNRHLDKLSLALEQGETDLEKFQQLMQALDALHKHERLYALFLRFYNEQPAKALAYYPAVIQHLLDRQACLNLMPLLAPAPQGTATRGENFGRGKTKPATITQTYNHSIGGSTGICAALAQLVSSAERARQRAAAPDQTAQPRPVAACGK